MRPSVLLAEGAVHSFGSPRSCFCENRGLQGTPPGAPKKTEGRKGAPQVVPKIHLWGLWAPTGRQEGAKRSTQGLQGQHQRAPKCFLSAPLLETLSFDTFGNHLGFIVTQFGSSCAPFELRLGHSGYIFALFGTLYGPEGVGFTSLGRRVAKRYELL